MEKGKPETKLQMTVEVPKGVLDFLEDLSKFGGLVGTPRSYIEREVAAIPETILSGLSDKYFDADWIREKYGLKQENQTLIP